MMTLKEVLEEARKGKRAVAHFNAADVAQLNGIITASRNTGTAVIIGVSEGERAFWGTDRIASVVRAIRENEGLPIFLNADHTHSLEKIKEAVDAGFDSVIYDSGGKRLDQNIAETKQVTEFVRDYNKEHGTDVLVEGELGYIGTSSEIFSAVPEGADISEKDITTVDDAVRYAKESGIDLLSPAVGNVHGMFKNAPNPSLYHKRIKEISIATGLPLVLHGGSGITDKDFLKAIESGITMVHISTRLRVAWRDALEKSLKNHPNEVAPYKIFADVQEAVRKEAEPLIKLFSGK